MCGRYTLHLSWAEIHELYDLSFKADRHRNTPPRYNIAPSQDVLVVRAEESAQRVAEVKWGLVPHWAKEDFKRPQINARGETVHEKPMFRTAFKHGRCLIPADGYYEWVKDGEKKQPYHLYLDGTRPFSFAGIWSRNEAQEIESCAIITGVPADQIKHIHNRMPVILPESSYAQWLDETTAPDKAQGMLADNLGSELTFHPVSTYVNSPRNQGEDCIEPVDLD